MRKETAFTASKLVISWGFVFAFLLFRHIFHEAHEFAHMAAGRFFSSGWGTRDFNNVQPFPTGANPSLVAQIITGLAGPMVNYLGCWLGAVLIRQAKGLKVVAAGCVLIFACLPFARIFTAAVGGGDEYGVVRMLIANAQVARWMTFFSITFLFALPLCLCYRSLPAKNKLLSLGCFLFLPMIVEGVLVLGLLNHLLKAGLLSQANYFGTPAFVTAVLLTCVLLLPFFRSKLVSFLVDNKPAQPNAVVSVGQSSARLQAPEVVNL